LIRQLVAPATREELTMFPTLAWRRSLLRAALMCAASSSTAFARQSPAPPDSLSRDLALALLGGGRFMVGTPKLYVGQLPPVAQNLLYVPPTARVLGTTEYATQSFTLMDVPGPPDSVRALVRRELARAGWKPAPQFAGYGGGFRYTTGTQAVPSNFCHDSLMLRVGFDQTTVPAMRVSYIITHGDNNGCAPRRAIANYLQMPTLFHPDGSLYDAVCSRALTGNIASTSTSAQVRSALSDDALLDHYARQLKDSGWTAASEVNTVSRTMSRTDSSGAQLETTLTIRTVGATGCKQIDLGLRRLRTP
jgi:hypothetical protein